MRFKKKHNVLTGEDDYVLESKSERQLREGAEVAAGAFVLFALVGAGLIWVLRPLFRALTKAIGKLPADAGERTERVVNLGFGTLAYIALAILAWPFMVGLTIVLPAHLLGIQNDYLFLIGSVFYWPCAIYVISKRIAASKIRKASLPRDMKG